MRNAAFLVILAILSSQVFAYSLQVKVTVAQDTLAVGTNISVVHEGVEIANAKAGIDGTAKFEVGPGSYFILLRRLPYPLHVNLVQVDKDTSITLIMREMVSYANAYGQIIGPTSFYNSSLTAYSGSQIAKRITYDKNGNPDSNGYYVLSFLPEGDYKLVFEAPGFEPKEERVFLPSSEFVELNAKLRKTEPKPEPEVSLVSSPSLQLHSAISVRLAKGGAPLAGEKILVKTPSGQLEILTSAEGIATVNAAEAGKYEFTYGNLTSTTEIKSATPKPEPPSPNATAPPEQPAAPAPASPPQGSSAASALAAGALGMAIIGAAAVAVLAAAWFFFFRKGEKQSRHEEAKSAPPRHGEHPHLHKGAGHSEHRKKHKEG